MRGVRTVRDLSLKETALAALHILLFAVAAVLIATFLLVWKLWGYVSLEQILFHFTVPLSGSFNSGLKIGIAVAVAGAVALNARKNKHFKAAVPCFDKETAAFCAF